MVADLEMPDWPGTRLCARALLPFYRPFVVTLDLAERRPWESIARYMKNATLWPTSPRFWGAMSLAILAGALTAYPINVWLVARRLKHGMGTVQVLGRGGHSVDVERQVLRHQPERLGEPPSPRARWELGSVIVTSLAMLVIGIAASEGWGHSGCPATRAAGRIGMTGWGVLRNLGGKEPCMEKYFMMRLGCGAHMVHGGHGEHGSHAGHRAPGEVAKDPDSSLAQKGV